MLIFTHAAVGALIGETIPLHPVLAFLLAFLIHFAMDAIPHGDSHLYKEYVTGKNSKKAVIITLIDIAAMLLLVAILFGWYHIDHPAAVAAGVIGGILPDILSALHGVFGIRRTQWLHTLHFFFHDFIVKRTGDLPFRVGMTMEVVIAAVLCVNVL
jgi:hypothetical protein